MRLKLSVLVLLAFAALARADEWKKDYNLTGAPELRVETDDGRIELSTWDQPTIHVLVVTQGWRIAPSCEHQRAPGRQSGRS